MTNTACLFRGKHIFERMNYLYQASKIISNTDKITSSIYGNAMINCAKKTVSKIDPDVKRTICKCCQSPLIPGETARIRLVTRPSRVIKLTCLLCKTSKRLVIRKDYKLWLEHTESTVKFLQDPVSPSKQSHSNSKLPK